jgi:protein LSM14
MTTTPFLGCKISLISKSEIRYEGILYTIDPKESTIALAKVRSYGTEERPAERQVPPREEIFEYIIFRAGDIKDLIVDDPPASIAPGLADPAIIQAHSTSTSSAATFPSSTFPQMTTNSNITSANSGQRTTGPAFQSATSAISSALVSSLSATNVTYNKTNSNESRSANSTPTGQQQRVKSPLNDGTTQTSAVKQTTNRDNKYFERRTGGERGAQHNYNRRGGQQSYQSNYHQSYPQQNRRGSGQQQNYNRSQPHNYSQPSQTGGMRFGSNYNRENQRENYGSNRQYSNYNSNYNARRAPMQSRPAPQRAQNRAPVRPKETIKFDGEFDFDKAQQEFKELEEKMTNLKMDANSAEKSKEENTVKESANTNTTNEGSTNGAQPDKEGVDSENEHFYDKGKSFFDHISCEALERERGNVQRIDWKAERKLNSETFGVPMSYRRLGFRGRGFSNARGYSGGSQYRNPSRGGYSSAVRSGGGGDTRRYNGPQRSRN